jgi:hypothetical protein
MAFVCLTVTNIREKAVIPARELTALSPFGFPCTEKACCCLYLLLYMAAQRHLLYLITIILAVLTVLFA